MSSQLLNILFTAICSLLAIRYSTAAITIDTVLTTKSTCANNGSLTVFAQTASPPLLYSIIDGPRVVPAQNSNTFNSLEPGVYQLQVSNFNNESITLFVSIFGNYSYPVFYPLVTNTTCSFNKDGRIRGNPNALTGTHPYLWKLTNNATGLQRTQTSDDFTNLEAGSYTLTLIDSCGNTTIQTVQLQNTNTEIQITNNPEYYVTGCYNTRISFNVQQTDGNNLPGPVSIRISTRNGSYTKPANIQGNTITEQIQNIGFGDTVNTIVFSGCGDSLIYTHYISPFDFYNSISTFYTSCNQQNTTVNFYLLSNTIIGLPIHYTLKDSVTGSIVEAGDRIDVSGILLSQHPGGKTYFFSINDSCGYTFSKYFYWPTVTIPPPTVGESFYTLHCLDSTASINIFYNNFPHQPTLVLLSGPPIISSTKPGYSYRDTLIYGQNITVTQSGYFQINNLAAGVYYYRVWDDCGTTLSDSFIITASMLGDDNYSISYIKGCPGANKLVLNLYTPLDTNHFKQCTGNYIIKNITTGSTVISNGYFYYLSYSLAARSDTVNLLSSGTYEITINYTSNWGSNLGYFPSLRYDCWSIIDTITIPAYIRPRVISAAQVSCHGNTSVWLNTDTTGSSPPFRYEIISGPQLFIPQHSNLFPISQTGSYIARIIDSCGTANTISFSIDTFSFPPINKFGSSCIGQKTLLTYQHSPYFVYQWLKPDGSIYVGDTLIIEPTTLADLGLYQITKVVTINGCVDSFKAYYQLHQNTEHLLYDTICTGDSVTIGSHTYYTTGTYRDTFSTAACDSIVILHLYADYRIDTLYDTLCAGKSISINNRVYTQPGIYLDTIAGTNCDRINLLHLAEHPYRRGQIVAIICDGETFYFAGNYFSQTGIYRDTIATQGCDSITVLYLSVLKPIYETTVHSMCQGESFKLYGHTYTATGVYRDTITANPCSKIIELTIQVIPAPEGDTGLQVYSIEYNEQITLDACIQDSAYNWSVMDCQNCPSVTVAPTEEYNEYQCTVVNAYGCSTTCYYRVIVNGIYGSVYTPNVFTPNDDGNNDNFKLFAKNIRLQQFQVFNRWGEKVFETSDPQNGWDGTYKGSNSPPGVYVYIVKYAPLLDGEGRILKGSVTLLR